MERFAVAKQRRIAVGNRRIVHRVEDRLVKSRKFSLPGKKTLSSVEREWSAIIIIDVGESPIERPKKNKGAITVEKAMQRGLGGFPHERLHQERKDILSSLK